jgi:hypothetical protein
MVTKLASNWIEMARKHKMFFVENTERGDAPPAVVAERNGNPIAMAIAPEVNKKMALYAANIFRVGAHADALTIVLDAHIAMGSAAEKYMKTPGSMQHACDEEGACETGEISDCLVCHRVTVGEKDNLNIQMATLRYGYHGKNGPPFRWIDEEAVQMEGAELGGYIIDSLKEIMLSASEKQKLFTEAAHLMGLKNKNKILFHTTRAVLQALVLNGFMVIASPEYVEQDPK